MVFTLFNGRLAWHQKHHLIVEVDHGLGQLVPLGRSTPPSKNKRSNTTGKQRGDRLSLGRENNEVCARYLSPRAGQIAASALVVDKGRSPGGRTRVVPAQLLPPSTLHARTRRMLRVFLCCRDDGIYCRRVYLASVDPPTSALPKKAEYTEHSSLPSG